MDVPDMICPICGSRMQQPEVTESGFADKMGFVCKEASCGFATAFLFDRVTYAEAASEEIRKRTDDLPADKRAVARLKSIEYGEKEQDPVFSAAMRNLQFEAFRETRRTAEKTLDALSHRETDPEKRKSSREELAAFFRFAEIMDGQYGDEKWEASFASLNSSFSALDSAYELGMLLLPSDRESARKWFQKGADEKRIRSSLALIRYFPEEVPAEERLERYRKLAPDSQEACAAAIGIGVPGKDRLSELLSAYAEKTYPSCAVYEQEAFLKLLLFALLTVYLPALASCCFDGEGNTRFFGEEGEEAENFYAVLQEGEAILSLLTGKIRELTGGSASLSADEQRILNAENCYLEYLIGVLMYYHLRGNPACRLKPDYLVDAIGHFDLFLAYTAPGREENGDTAQPEPLSCYLSDFDTESDRQSAAKYREAFCRLGGFRYKKEEIG